MQTLHVPYQIAFSDCPHWSKTTCLLEHILYHETFSCARLKCDFSGEIIEKIRCANDCSQKCSYGVEKNVHVIPIFLDLPGILDLFLAWSSESEKKSGENSQ